MAQDFLGRGWAFPVGVTPSGGIALAEGEDDIKQAIRIILSTALGERAMRPDFGCEIHSLLFEPSDPTLPRRAEYYARTALERWEPRIELDSISASLDGAKLTVEVNYRVRATNRRDNIVYPYYLEGGE